MNRRNAIKSGLALSAAAMMPAQPLAAQGEALILRKIPSSGESLPVIGIGTARRYDVGPSAPERAELKEVIRLFCAGGGKVIDSAPSYGEAETVVGDLVAALDARKSVFLATKVGARDKADGKQQIEDSFRRLRTRQIDCIAVHNLLDTVEQLAALRELKRASRIRYFGMSTSFDQQYAEFERYVRGEKLDFIQVDYAIDNRDAAARIIPLAADRGAGVMINLPFGRGRLFDVVRNKPLPPWTQEFDCSSWAQFFLKYIIAHPAVTCAIPGTAQVKYVQDNLGAARGRLPDAALRKRMEKLIDEI